MGCARTTCAQRHSNFLPCCISWHINGDLAIVAFNNLQHANQLNTLFLKVGTNYSPAILNGTG